MKISARWWNETLAEPWRAKRLRSVRRLRGEPPQHPWQTSLRWDVVTGGWVGQTLPGHLRRRVGPQLETSVVVTDLSGETLPLGRDPRFAVTGWRAVGTDAMALGAAAEPVPEFFLARGVRPATEITADAWERGILGSAASDLDPVRPRLLRAADVVLEVFRLATIYEGALETETAQIGVRYVAPPDGTPAARLVVQSGRFDPEAPPPDPVDLLIGRLLDDGRDRRLIATLYLLSPADAVAPAAGQAPSADWQPFVRHATFYDLAHAVPFVAPPTIEPLRLSTGGLAGGVAEPLADALSRVLSAELAAAAAFAGATQAGGFFWTV